MLNQTEMVILETLYFIVIFSCSTLIFSRLRRLYKFSKYKGLKYFGNAFLYLGIGFAIRYIAILFKIIYENRIIGTIAQFNILTILTQFTLSIPGFFFLYSLIWKNLETKKYGSGLSAQIIIHFAALAVVLTDFVLKTMNFMYITQILLFLSASIIAYKNAINSKNKTNKTKWMVFVSMKLMLLAWILNFIAQHTIDSTPVMRIYTYIFTATTCLILVFAVTNLTKNFNKN